MQPITLILLDLFLSRSALSSPMVKSPDLFFASHTPPNIPRSIDVREIVGRSDALPANTDSTSDVQQFHKESRDVSERSESYSRETYASLLFDHAPLHRKASTQDDYHDPTRRWNNEYFDQVEESHLDTINEDEQSHWLNYCIPSALLVSVIVGNMLMLFTCLGVFIGFRAVGVLWRRGRTTNSTAESKDNGLELATSSKRSADLSEEEEESMRNSRGDLPSWAID